MKKTRRQEKRVGVCWSSLLFAFFVFFLLCPRVEAAETPRVQTIPFLFDIATGTSPNFLVLDSLHSFYRRDFPVSSLWVPLSARLVFSYRVVGERRPAAVLVTLNGQVVSRKRLRIDEGIHHFSLAIPAEYFLEDNHLGIGLYHPGSRHCILPSRPRMRLRILGPGSLTLTEAFLPPVLQLSRLPFPILDLRSGQPANIGVLLPENPDQHTLRAAGLLALWLGSLNRFGEIRFDAATRPTGREENRIVFEKESDSSGTSAPAARLEPMAGHHFSLVLTGRNGADYLGLVHALIRRASPDSRSVRFPGGKTVDGSRPGPVAKTVSVWLRPGEKTTLNILSATSTLRVSGFPPPPLNIGFMLPPGLFTWNSPGLGVHYRLIHDDPWQGARTFLRILANGHQVFFQDLPASYSRTSGPRSFSGVFHIPFYDLGRQNQLQFQVGSVQPVNQVCATPYFGKTHYRLSEQSFLDLSGTYRWGSLPDLSRFLHWGSPFTDHADLSGAVILLGSFSNRQDLSRSLNLLARWGTMIRSPWKAPDIRKARSPGSLGNKNVLFIGTFSEAFRFRRDFPGVPVNWQPEGASPIEDVKKRLLKTLLEGGRVRVRSDLFFRSTADYMVGEFRYPSSGRVITFVLFRKAERDPYPFLAVLDRIRPENLDRARSWLWSKRDGDTMTVFSRRVFLSSGSGHLPFLIRLRYVAYKFKTGFFLLVAGAILFRTIRADRVLTETMNRRLTDDKGEEPS